MSEAEDELTPCLIHKAVLAFLAYDGSKYYGKSKARVSKMPIGGRRTKVTPDLIARIKELRKLKDGKQVLTQDEVAERLGVSRCTVRKFQ